MNKRHKDSNQVSQHLEYDKYGELSQIAPPILVQSANVSNSALMLEDPHHHQHNFNNLVIDSSEGERPSQMPRVQGQGGGYQYDSEITKIEESK